MENISMKYELDEIDFEIMDELKADAAKTRKQLAKKLGLPLTTVHNRIEKMEKNGVIKGYTAIIDRKKTGRGIGAYIDATVNYISPDFSQQDIARKILLMSEVDEVSIVTGEKDLLIKVHVASTDDLNEFITKKLRSIKGIDKTSTSAILQDLDKREIRRH
jgi:Lrp/AsnC family transcriptional regulator, leucine-responsive regulatory protein